MSNAVTNAILDYLNANPAADNDSVAAHVRRTVPGSTTSAASVSSVKSRLKREGHQFQRAPNANYVATGDDGEQLPTLMVRPQFGAAALPETDPSETLEEAKSRIAVRYDAMERMTRRLVAGKVPSLIISGPPGLGKSYTVREALAERFPDGPEKSTTLDEEGADAIADEDVELDGQLHYDTVSGSISAVGLYQALWYTRNGGILVLDDVDDVFRDETALNLLKGALDSSPIRTISWRKEARWLEENGIPDRFQFKGHVVFLTNIDFEQVIQSGKRDAEHFKALIDRSMYLCLTLRTRRDFMIRIRQVAGGAEGMLVKNFGLTEEQSEEVLDFVTEHQTRFYNLSLRLVGQVALCMAADPVAWQKDVEATKMRTM
ncbi:AAA-ATPase [Rhodobacter phage RcRudolph]|nr:AAA-ATPase [Rhodobacter phage RcRudolph]